MTKFKRVSLSIFVIMVCLIMFIGFSVPVFASSEPFTLTVNGVDGYVLPDCCSSYPAKVLYTIGSDVYLICHSSPSAHCAAYSHAEGTSPNVTWHWRIGFYGGSSCSHKLLSDGTSSNDVVSTCISSVSHSVVYNSVPVYSSHDKSDSSYNKVAYPVNLFPTRSYNFVFNSSSDVKSYKSYSPFSTLEVSSSGAVISFVDGTSYNYAYSGDLALRGFSISQSGPIVYSVGNTYDISDLDSIQLFVRTRSPSWKTLFPDLASIAGSFFVQIRNVANTITSNPLILLCTGFLFLGGCIGIFVRLSSRN